MAGISYGRPWMTKFEVIKETEKMLMIDSGTAIFGNRQYDRRIHKENDNYFDDSIDAVVFLITHQIDYVKKAQENLDSASNHLSILKALLAKLRCADLKEKRK